jgi:hypothetical protein
MTASWVRSARHHDNVWVPGRWIGGIALLVGPVVFLAGLVVRHVAVAVATFSPAQEAWFDEQTFAAPRQLAAYAQHPGLVTTGYTLFAAGSVLMVPALLAFGRVVARGAPRLAYWGALLLVLAQLRRLYFGGIEVTAFRLVDTIGLDRTTDWVLDNYVDVSYGLWRIPVTLSVGSIVGGVLLAAGAYRAGLFGVARCLLLVAWAYLWSGFLKESALIDGVGLGAAGVVALLPAAVMLLRGRWPDLDPVTTPAGTTRPALRVW